MLSAAVEGVNTGLPQQHVWFIDPNPRYDGHRFCEEGVNDPDAARDDTWLFLSGWQDNSLPSTTSVSNAVGRRHAICLVLTHSGAELEDRHQ